MDDILAMTKDLTAIANEIIVAAVAIGAAYARFKNRKERGRGTRRARLRKKSRQRMTARNGHRK